MKLLSRFGERGVCFAFFEHGLRDKYFQHKIVFIWLREILERVERILCRFNLNIEEIWLFIFQSIVFIVTTINQILLL